MKQKLLNSFRLKATLLVAVLCALFTGTAWATDVTFTPGTDTGATSVTKSGVTATMTTMNNASYYQIYANQSATFSVASGNITKIEFTCTASGTSKYGPGNSSANVGSYSYSGSTGTWTGEASSITISSTAQVRMTSLTITYTAAAPSYTITAQSNNTSYGTVSLNGSVITGSPKSGCRYATPAYTVSSGTATVSQSGNDFTVTPSSDCTVTINFEALPAYTVTLSDDTENPLTEASAGAGVTLPSRSAIGSYTFAGWSETDVVSETTTAPATIIPVGTYNPTGNITLYPVYTKTEGGGTVNNTASKTISAYATANSWSNGVQYGSVTLDANVTATASGGGNTGKYYTTGNEWRLYQSESATLTIATTSGTLTSATITYSISNGGKLTYGGAAVNSGSEISISGTSAVFNVENSGSATNGQVKITAIEVNYSASGSTTYYWSSPVVSTVERPEITIADNPFLFNTTATITCATTGATIYYTLDGSDPTTSSNEYSTAIPLTATTTIKAFAVLGSDESTVASVTATKNLAEPTVTVSGDLTLDLDGGTEVEAGTLTAAVTYNEAAVGGATVTWSSSNTDIATIDEGTGAVTLLTTGEVTFTATYAGNSDYASATGTKTVTVVDSNQPGSTEGNPYTVAQARNAIDNSGNVTNVYVRGIVCTGGSSLSSGAMNYWISDDGTETNKFEIYRGKGINNANFTSTDDIQVGDVVVVYGNIVLYNSTTYEFSSGSQLVSLFRKAENTITVTGGTSFNIDRNNSESSLTFSATAASGTTVTYTIDTSNTTLASADYNLSGSTLTVTGTSAGTIIVTASAAGNSEYKDGEATITVTVLGVKSTPTIIVNDTEVAYGSNFTIDDSVIEGGAITVSCDEAVDAAEALTISDLTITPNAVGTFTITVATAANEFYNEGSETFELTVTAPAGRTETSSSILFNETFSGCTGTGGNKTGDFSNGSQNGSVSGKTNESYSTITSAYPASGCARLGTGSANGVLTTNTISLTGNATLTFSGAGWKGSDTNTITVTATGATLSGDTNITLTNAEWKDYSIDILDATGSVTITFTEKRGFLDDIVISQDPASTVQLNKYGYGTYCSVNPMDFSSSSTDGYTAWRISSIDMDGTTGTVNCVKITEAIKGGQGVLLYNKDADGVNKSNVTVNFAYGDTESEFTSSENLLKGTTAPTYKVAGTVYGLSGNAFVPSNANGIIFAGKAYIDADDVPELSSVKAFTFVFVDPATGITETRTATREEVEGIFNLAGQRLGKMQKGINIVNGKKLLVK